MSDPELTFGEILHAAFTAGSAAASEPEDQDVMWVQSPPVVRPMTPEEVACYNEKLRLYNLWCLHEAGTGCARWIAANCNLPYAQVWAEMIQLPDNILAMMDSPSGWSVIAAAIMRSLRDGDDLPPFPTIH
ncbi:hypothetical protein GS397_00900 [Sphingobium yanoikuyae]|uniref:Uncharacterized protein n=1 Tax=Sphingobium yanoikuyae TaxID=13690 RepID=A0A6P1GBM9_SPHYA|nr:hypothetical protein [Sphingobium yanoikuyae]QHD65768.1 hypothetical protein GS397_00900 [Sphingobium yanoikuyae]